MRPSQGSVSRCCLWERDTRKEITSFEAVMHFQGNRKKSRIFPSPRDSNSRGSAGWCQLLQLAHSERDLSHYACLGLAVTRDPRLPRQEQKLLPLLDFVRDLQEVIVCTIINHPKFDSSKQERQQTASGRRVSNKYRPERRLYHPRFSLMSPFVLATPHSIRMCHAAWLEVPRCRLWCKEETILRSLQDL